MCTRTDSVGLRAGGVGDREFFFFFFFFLGGRL